MKESEKVLPAYQQVTTHIIWDVKMEDLRRKARLVADDHETEVPPPSETSTAVVSKEAVRIAFTLAALNGLRPRQERPMWRECWMVWKNAGAIPRNHLAACMRHLGYTPCGSEA